MTLVLTLSGVPATHADGIGDRDARPDTVTIAATGVSNRDAGGARATGGDASHERLASQPLSRPAAVPEQFRA